MSVWSLDFISDMDRMRREMDRFLDEFGSPGWSLPFSRTSFLPGRAARGYPLLNIFTSMRWHREWTRKLSMFRLNKTC